MQKGSIDVTDLARPSTDRAIERVDRDEVFLEYTKSICPICKQVVDAEVNVRDNKVFLRKRCRNHGSFEALVYSDAEMYLGALRFNKPGTYPLTTQTEIAEGCPLDCGLCPDHKQHACVGLLEVNSRCNLDCPICFADSGHQPHGFELTHDQVAVALDAFVAAEGEPEVLMLSGGEPTIHPSILDFVDMATDRGIKHVVINTNGIKLAQNQGFAAALAERDVGIYLQFDGFEEGTHLAVRGRDLREIKRRALDMCVEVGLLVQLTAAIEKGVNDHEMGAIVRYGIEHPAVRGVVFQPVTHAGRMIEYDPLDRMTNPDVIHGLAGQLPQWFRASDFFPVPCCFPTCRSVTYCLVDGDEVVPVPRLIDLEDYLDYVTNRVFPDLDIKRALEKLWSASSVPGSKMTAEQLECATCGIDLPTAVRELGDKVFMITVQDFQDPYTLNVKQLMKCCVEHVTPDGRLIPFCAYNSVGYREQVRQELTGVALHAAVPHAVQLTPVLIPTVNGSKAHLDDRHAHTEQRDDARNLHTRPHVSGNGTNVGRGLR